MTAVKTFLPLVLCSCLFLCGVSASAKKSSSSKADPAGIYHADHRELVSHENQWPFEVVNYMDLIAECMGIDRPDMFKRLKLMQDADAIVAETMEMIATHDMDLESVRDAVLRYLLGDQFLPIDRAKHPAPGPHMDHGAQ